MPCFLRTGLSQILVDRILCESVILPDGEEIVAINRPIRQSFPDELDNVIFSFCRFTVPVIIQIEFQMVIVIESVSDQRIFLPCET